MATSHRTCGSASRASKASDFFSMTVTPAPAGSTLCHPAFALHWHNQWKATPHVGVEAAMQCVYAVDAPVSLLIAYCNDRCVRGYPTYV